MAIPNHSKRKRTCQTSGSPWFALLSVTFVDKPNNKNLEAEAEAEAERAAEQTKAAQTFFTDTKTGMGLGIDFSNPMNLSSAMGNIGDFNASSGRNSGVVLRANPFGGKIQVALSPLSLNRAGFINFK